MGYSTFGLIILIADLYAIYQTLTSSASTAAKVVWTLVILFLPVIGLIQVGSQARADRYLYLPLVGLAIAAALAATHRVVAIDARGHGQSEKPHDAMRYGPRSPR